MLCTQCFETANPPGTTRVFTLPGTLAKVFCEGCGYTEVDNTGRCISPTCKIHGGNP